MSQYPPLMALLASQPFVLLDGAMATELEARGCHLAAPLWPANVLLEAPAIIRLVHLDYFRAGAQMARQARVLYQQDNPRAGTLLVGGCCRTTPEDIAALRLHLPR